MYGLWNNLKTVLLMSGLMGLCMAVAYALGGPHAMVYGLMIGGIMNVLAFLFSDKIALMTVRAVPVDRSEDPVLWDTVQQLAIKAGLPMPRVYISPAAAPNAFATGRSPRHSAVCVTAGLRQLLTDRELEGVIAHELAHIRHRDILISTIAAIVAGAITWLAHIAFFVGPIGSDRNRRSNPLVMLLILILAPLAATLIQLAISRAREFEADRAGARLVGSGRPLAQALAKLDAASKRFLLPVPDAQANMFIVAPLTGSDVAKLFMTHPPVEERIARLNAM
ncbi:MAG: M48 family metalloprotease [Sedimentisphaerales bacterium]|jgi:heat shock protein HtpX|nr:M48 family metalloprotease [Sedimentisphaerales bacterium]